MSYKILRIFFKTVQFNPSILSNSLWPHWLQHARLPCLSATPGACSNSCPLSQWCHPTILCRPLLLSPSIFQSIRVFSSESAICIRWPKYCNFSFSISPSKKYSGLTSFRIDWWDLLTVQGTLKSFLQHHISKASILQEPAFFMVQFSHPYYKNHSFGNIELCSKVMSLLFNTLSRFVIAFLLRCMHLLICGCSQHLQWFWSPRK